MGKIIILLGGTVLAIIVALVIIFAVTHKASKSAPVVLPTGDVQPQSNVLIIDNCTNTGRYEPTTIELTCGDGSAEAGNLSWSQWGSTEAIGRGSVDELTCIPNCANGQDVTYRVQLKLSEPVKAANGTDYYTRIAVSYLGKAPNGSHVVVYKDCYDTPPAPYVPSCPADERGAS